jgi:4-amino-4-deoxy-L-arabinose transferase-like glycosyltransferase
MARKRSASTRAAPPKAPALRPRGAAASLARPALLWVLALALLARLWGITDRLPDPSIGIRAFDDSVVEETDRVTMGLAWSMWQGGTRPVDLNPHTGGWPSLSAYLTLGVQLLCRAWFAATHPGAGAAAFARHAEAHWDSIFLVGRCAGALLGVASVALTFALGSALLGPAAGVAAALILALNPLHIQTSQHVGDPNLLALFFVLVATWAIVRIAERGAIVDSIVAGAGIGLAAASKYAPIVLLPALVLAHAGGSGRLHARIAEAFRSRALWIGITSLGIAFFIGSPFTILDWNTTFRDLSIQRERLLSDWVGETALPISLPTYLFNTLPDALGWPAYLMALAGLVVLWRSGKPGRLAASVPVLLVLANGMLRTAQGRYVLPAVPVLCVAASAALLRAGAWMASRVPAAGRARSLAPVALLLLCVTWLLPGYAATRASLAMPDTRHAARAWIDAHIDPAQPMAVDLYGPSFNTVRRDERAAVTWPFYATLAPLVRPAYDYAYLDGLRYVVTSSEVSRRFESMPRAYPVEAAYYARIRERAPLVWTSDSVRASGPRIELRALPPRLSTRSERDSVFARLLPRPNGSDRVALWCLQMGQLFGAEGQFDRMEEWASRGRRVGASSMNGDLAATLAYAQLALERPADAEQTARAGIAEAPGNAALHLYLGVALRTIGRNEEALESFRRAFALAPEQEVRIYMAETLAALGRRGESADLYRQAADGEPDPAQAQRLRAEAARLGADSR